jgi:hypothetical protein
MLIKIGSFELDTSYRLYIRVPWIGAAHCHPRLGWIWDTWADIRRVEG